jgi:hypothetical protein
VASLGAVASRVFARDATEHESAANEASDVPWLADVQRPPASVPREKVGELEPLLVTGDGKPIETLEAWKSRRRELREAWLKFLGPMPLERPPVRLEMLREERLPDCIRQLVEYEGEPGQPVQGYLLRPAAPAAGKRPGILGLHQTTTKSIDEIAGVSGPDAMQIGLKLAQRGFVVFCPRCFLWQDAANYTEAVQRFRRQHPDTLGMHKMLYDAMRGVDVLASLPDVDSRRIGSIGHSLGAKETLYVAAFDERVRAGVASEGGVGFKFTNWDAPWYLGSGINEPDFKLNHHQLLALIAPRPFLILAGENSSPAAADGDRTWPFIEAALPVYRLYGAPARIGLLNHRQGHSLPPDAFARATQWLETYLAE